jgi:hypothetical protein
MFGIIEKDVQVGVNPDMDPRKSHGSAKVFDSKGTATPVFFTVDHPKRLRRPTTDQVRDIFKQFGQLGVFPSSIVIATGKRRHMVFRRDGIQV